MKIAPKDIESFLTKIPQHIKAILFYGPDQGLVSYRAEQMQKSFNIAGRFKYEKVKNNPNLILDDLKSFSLFDDNQSKQKIAIIECSGNSLTEPLLGIVKKSDHAGMLIFCATDLGTDSSLRKCFEGGDKIAAIPCYVDDQSSIARIIQQQLKLKQCTCSADFIPTLINYISVGDHLLVLNEIDKILLFLEGKKHFTSNDLNNYLEIQEDTSFDKLNFQLSLRQKKDFDSLILRLENEGHNSVAIIRVIMRHFFRLYQTKSLIDQGISEQAAMDRLQPKVFFKQLNDFVKSLKLWQKEELFHFLDALNQLELNVKQKPHLANLLLKKTITEGALNVVS